MFTPWPAHKNIQLNIQLNKQLQKWYAYETIHIDIGICFTLVARSPTEALESLRNQDGNAS